MSIELNLLYLKTVDFNPNSGLRLVFSKDLIESIDPELSTNKLMSKFELIFALRMLQFSAESNLVLQISALNSDR